MCADTLTPLRPALRCDKWRLAEWVLAHFPQHATYVEPFGGSADVLLQKPLSTVEVYNDQDGEVVNFFSVLREHADRLVRAIKMTPYARAELERAFEPTEDALERARRFYVRTWQQEIRPVSQRQPAWHYERAPLYGRPVIEDWNETDRLYEVAFRLKQVQIECDSCEAVIARYDERDTLFYVDPPYVQDPLPGEGTRTTFDHVKLAEQLRTIRGMAIISGRPSELYDAIYQDWRCVQCLSRTGGVTSATECLWLSPLAEAAGQRRPLLY